MHMPVGMSAQDWIPLGKPMGEGPHGGPAQRVATQQGNRIPTATAAGGTANALSRSSHYSGGFRLCTLQAYAVCCVVLLGSGVALFLISVPNGNWDTVQAGIACLVLFGILAILYWLCDRAKDRTPEAPWLALTPTTLRNVPDPLEEVSVHSLSVEPSPDGELRYQSDGGAVSTDGL